VPRPTLPLLALLTLLACLPARAHEVAAEMAQAAGTFLAALDAGQRKLANYPLTDAERENWNFVPLARQGVPFKRLTTDQQALGLALLRTGLSHAGQAKAQAIIALELVLKELEKDTKGRRDPTLYYLTFFGEPGPAATWGWRFEGHHLSINLTLAHGKVVSGTPNFMGSNPAEVRVGSRQGLRALGAEEDLGRDLLTSLPADLQAKAIVDPKAPDDILTSNARKAQLGDPRGVTLADMPEASRAKALQLLREYVGRLRDDVATAEIEKIEKAGTQNIRFAWAGSIAKGQRHYYRLAGPTFLLEYDNTQNDANHIHAVWRNPDNDFGLDVLADHLRNAHGK